MSNRIILELCVLMYVNHYYINHQLYFFMMYAFELNPLAIGRYVREVSKGRANSSGKFAKVVPNTNLL